MLLNCQVQQYAWGKVGQSSQVARLKSSSDSSFSLNPSQPYAELWMGTHLSGPSRILDTGNLLSEFLRGKDALVGNVPEGYPTDDLPFLFKILSVQTALSIQSHPDKLLARELHASYPQHYKDPNHKPEMVLAITPFEAMCGFRSISDIRSQVLANPELRAILGEEVYSELESTTSVGNLSDGEQQALVKRIFCAFMNSSDSVAGQALEQFLARTSGSSDPLLKLCNRLHNEYPGDRGSLAPLLLNVIYLQPGQSFFMGPNEPHAYLFGDCIECMALSDNVVRAGLTPKFKHVDVLCSMLHYRCGAPQLIEPIIVDEFTKCFRPDPTVCIEFELDVSTFPAATRYRMRALPCASLVLILRGSPNIIKPYETQIVKIGEGSVLFLGAGEELQIDAEQDLCIVRAHVNTG